MSASDLAHRAKLDSFYIAIQQHCYGTVGQLFLPMLYVILYKRRRTGSDSVCGKIDRKLSQMSNVGNTGSETRK